MSSVPWKKLCLVASVLCFVVGILGVEITHNQRIKTVIEQSIFGFLKRHVENATRETLLRATGDLSVLNAFK